MQIAFKLFTKPKLRCAAVSVTLPAVSGSVDVTNELLSSLILSKANYPVRLNVEISIGKNHRDIQLQETNNIDIIHMTKSDYACVSV